MFGRHPAVNPLEVRKQLLVAESDLNRARALVEWHNATDGLVKFARPFKSLAGLAVTVTELLMRIFRGPQSSPTTTKNSWLKRIGLFVDFLRG